MDLHDVIVGVGVGLLALGALNVYGLGVAALVAGASLFLLGVLVILKR